MSGIARGIGNVEWLDSIHTHYDRQMVGTELAELFGWEGLPAPVHAAADRDAVIAARMSQLAHSHHEDS